MSHQYFKKVSLAVAGLVLSVLLAVLAEGLMSMNTPGAQFGAVSSYKSTIVLYWMKKIIVQRSS
jgi:hypothetical protein